MRILTASILALAITTGSAACGGAQKASSTGGGDDVGTKADRPEPGTGGADADNPCMPPSETDYTPGENPDDDSGNDTGDATDTGGG